jgi:acyl transferase domain-containing protein
MLGKMDDSIDNTVRGSGRNPDIAVVGMSVLVPGAHELDAFWQNILAEELLFDSVPEDRWDSSLYLDPNKQTKDKIYCDKGSFLDSVLIDCMAFGIPPASVASIEPAQLLALEAVKRAISDAGYADKSFDRSKTSVIFGSAG